MPAYFRKMPGTFSQIYIHIVFCVKHRAKRIRPDWEDRLYKYIIGIVDNKQQKVIAVNGVEDHIHVLIRTKPVVRISEMAEVIKANSSKFINTELISDSNTFRWQSGYASFSVSPYFVDTIIRYIQNQKEHYAKKSFKEEYKQLLIDADVVFEE
jgi:putative transposase